MSFGKKERWTLIGIVLSAGCHAAQVFYPDFPADQMAGYVVAICGIFMGTHTISDIAHMITNKGVEP